MAAADSTGSEIGLYGLAVMGQNLALNIADKGHTISVCNRSPSKVDDCVARAKTEGLSEKLTGYKDLAEFVASLSKPRNVILLVKAGKPVEAVIDALLGVLEEGDMIIDGGNEWYENTERRLKKVGEKGILYLGMGVSGGEDGARYGPSLMPGGSLEGYKRVEKILLDVAAKATDGTVCCSYVGDGGAGNYVKMVHNGIEYGDMQLIAEAYDLLRNIAGLTNDEIADVFTEYNSGELESFLIEITSHIFRMKDDRGPDKTASLLDKVLDKTGQKGTGRWTVREAAEHSVASPTISSALDARNLSALLDERRAAAAVYGRPTEVSDAVPESSMSAEEKKQFIEDVKFALYASKICSYTQGMNLIRRVGELNEWKLNLGSIASLWKAGCIIRAVFLDRITAAYEKNPELPSLLVDADFAKEISDREVGWKRVVTTAIMNGIPAPAMSGSLMYFNTYTRARLPANLTQAQRDYFGAHTYQRTDDVVGDEFVHSKWSDAVIESEK
jgi:6-phosphogluconate dehydrogenase